MPKKSLFPKSSNIKISKNKINEFREIFDILDRNKTGIISTKDIIKIRKIFYFPISEKNINEIINEIDISGNGKFNFKEFVILMKKQIEYIEEADENIILKTCKEEFRKEFLGNKRKREKKKNENLKYNKRKYSKRRIENENIIEDIIIEEDNDDEGEGEDDTSFSSENIINKNINNNNHIIINKSAMLENNNNKYNLEKKEENNYNKINNKNNSFINRNSKNKVKYDIQEIKEISLEKNSKKEKSKSKIDLELINAIVIYKKDLSQELINQIEQINNKNNKNNNHFYIKIDNNNNNNNIINSFSISSDIGSIPRKGNNEFNSGIDFSFSSDCINFDSMNKSLNSPFNFNSRLDMNMTPPKNNQNGIQKCIDDYLIYIDNKNEKTDTGFLNNLNIKQDTLKKKIQELNKKNFEMKSQNSISNSFLFSENDNNNNLINNMNLNLNNETGISHNNNNFNNLVFNDNIIDIEKANTNKKNQNLENKNIQILNTFEFEYKKNRRKEKKIINSIEIPYLIIIDKNAINIGEITKNNINNESKKVKSSYSCYTYNKKKNEGGFQYYENNKNISVLVDNYPKDKNNSKMLNKRKETQKPKIEQNYNNKSKKYKSQEMRASDKKRIRNKYDESNEIRDNGWQKFTYIKNKGTKDKKYKKNYIEDFEEVIYCE